MKWRRVGTRGWWERGLPACWEVLAQTDKFSWTVGWELIERAERIDSICMTQVLKARPVHSIKWGLWRTDDCKSCPLSSHFTLLNIIQNWSRTFPMNMFQIVQSFVYLVKTQWTTGGLSLKWGFWVESAGWAIIITVLLYFYSPVLPLITIWTPYILCTLYIVAHCGSLWPQIITWYLFS